MSSKRRRESGEARIDIDLDRQQLDWTGADGEHRRWSISTALSGPGEADGSGCTPRGAHYIRAMVGHGQPERAVFVGRRPTGEIWTPELSKQYPGRDWILTRILWLCGLETGRNRGPGIDSFRRFIYIHGTPDTEPMGEPLSHGCVRMRNRDVLALFERVEPGCRVFVHSSTGPADTI